jgi:hypothetical protein
MEINSYLLRERTPPIVLGANGVVGAAATTVDVVSNIGVTASAAGLTFTLANPTDTRSGRSILVMNTGANAFSMYANSVKPGQYIELIWGSEDNSWHSPSVPQESAADFFRSGSLTGLMPDGTTDTQDAIFRSGQVVIDTGANGDSGMTLDDLRSRNSVQLTAGDAGVTDTNMTAIGVDTTGKVRLSNQLSIPDLRATVTNPQDYAAGYSHVFKQTSVLGMAGIPGLPTYVDLITTRQYANATDFSGGNVRQDIDLPDGRQYFRMSTSGTTWGPWLLESRDRNLQDRFTSQATTKISLTGEVRWNGFYHIMSRGTNTVEPSGYFRIDMPADGFAIPVADGTTRAVVPAVAGSAVDTGGIPLNIWESLYYKHVPGSAPGIVPANFMIVLYTTNTNAVSVFTESDDWVMVARRDNQNAFVLGTGDVVGLGAQIGRGGEITTANWQAMKQRAMGDGYYFVPAGNSAVSPTFGFTGSIRWIDGGSTPYVNSAGYVDAPATRASGLAIKGVNGAADRTWRLMLAAEKPTWFGGALRGNNPINPATTTVVDLNDNETLYYVPNIDVGTNVGQWVVAGYSGFVTTPVHWLPIASKQTTGGHSTIQVLVGGVQYALKAGDARYTTTNDSVLDGIRRNQNITHKGLKYCRWATVNLFAGAAANGLTGSASAIYSSWDDNTLIYGISDGYTNFGTQYAWLNVPTAGAQIPVVSTNSNITRVVKQIGAHRYIPLSLWEALYWIPPAYIGGTTSVDGDWVIVDYGLANQHIPANAVMVLKYEAAAAGTAGTTTAKNRVKFADGTYMQPGMTFPASVAVEAEYDHAQGSGDWRPVTVAGGTAPGMTAALPAIAGVLGNYAAPYSSFFRYLPSDADPRGQIEIEGLLNLNNDIADGSVIAFLPGVNVRGLPVHMAHAIASTLGDTKLIPVQIRFDNAIINGSSGVRVIAYFGFTAANPYRTLGANGGASAAGLLQWVSLGPLTLPHA